MRYVSFFTTFVTYFVTYCVVSGNNSGNPLFLSPLIEAGKLEEAKLLSRVRDRKFCCTQSYSGFLTVDEEFNSNLFFWFFKSKNPKAPVLIWLQGGPGASSMFGLFNVNGPFKITKNLELKRRKYRWTKAFSVLYIDSPVGAGFSFTENDSGYAKSLADVTDNLYVALKQFFTLFGELRYNHVYIAGESYTGKYATALAYKIHTENEKIINLKGISVGNGVFDPISTLAFGKFLHQVRLIDEKQRIIFNDKEKEIQSLIQTEQFEAAFHKWDKLIGKMLFNGTTIFEQFTGYSYAFDIRYTTDPYDSSLIELFLNESENRKALHVGNLPYFLGIESNITIVNPMIDDIFRSVKPMVAVIMDNYKVLFYSGNMDIILSPSFGYRFLKSLNWQHQDEYLSSTRDIWKVAPNDNKVAGYIRRVQDFREVIVLNAGHTVPAAQPMVAFEMVTKFVSGEL